jgi:hypothetical protein
MKMKVVRKVSIAVLICVLSAMIPAAAFSWNQATHAYIADRLDASVGHDNLNEMWGSTAPDMFNFVFDPTLCPGWIADQTQGTYSDTFLKVWNAADTHDEEAMAYGFASHNEQWGADHIAHETSLTLGQDEGYIIAKETILLDTPYPADPQKTFGDVFADLGMSPYEGEMVAHLIAEYAIDIMLRNDADPLLGRKLATAAHARSKEFPGLLIKAFGSDYADYCFGGDTSTAASVLIAVEEEHRKEMIFLGWAISQPEPVAVQLLAERVVSILPEFMGAPLPVSDADAVEIVKSAIYNAMTICDDYMAEINATIEYVDKNLKEHGITYSIHGNPKGKL